MKLEINFIFLIKLFCYMTKKSRQKLKYLENEEGFWGEIKNIFHLFWKRFQLPKIVSDLRAPLILGCVSPQYTIHDPTMHDSSMHYIFLCMS